MTTDGSPNGTRGVLPILSSISMVIIAVMPAYLTGALAVSIRAELGFGPSALGLAVSWFFLMTALPSTPMGQVVERLGARRSLALGALITSVGLTGIGLAPSLVGLLAAMTINGVANAMTQPAVNMVLATRTPPGRRGLAFGIKQAGIPASTLLAGLSIPTLAVLVGWRGTFGVAAAVALGASALAWRSPEPPGVVARRVRRRTRDIPEVGSLVILTIGALLAGGAATSLGVFMVDAAVDIGIEEARAGLMFALVSGCGLLARVSLGWYADLRPTQSKYGTIALLFVMAVPGYLLLTSGTPAAYWLGGFLGFVAGWSWPGLFHFAVISQNPSTPAAATGLIQTGLSMGAGVGPLVFGAIAEWVGYSTAWLVAGATTAVAAVVLLAGRSHLRRARRTGSVAHLDEVRAVRWDDAHWEPARDDVRVQPATTEHLRIRLYRAPSGATFEGQHPTRSGILYVLAGDGATVRLAGGSSQVRTGDHVPLAAYRPWSVTNAGTRTLVVAQVEQRQEDPPFP